MQDLNPRPKEQGDTTQAEDIWQEPAPQFKVADPAQAPFDKTHCVNGGGLIGNGYVNAVLVLDLDALSDEYRIPENQLFWCDMRVYEMLVGTLLNTEPETSAFIYKDFIGVLDEKHLPAWAKDAIAEMNAGIEATKAARPEPTESPSAWPEPQEPDPGQEQANDFDLLSW